MTEMTAAAAPVPDVARLGLADLRAALQAGWRDYRRAPAFGCFFAAVYVLIGIGFVLFGAGTVLWTFAFSLAFPLFAPFAAVGLYEVSRRLDRGGAMDWYKILGVVIAEKDRQIPWMGAIIVIYVLFWSFLAHMIFALFMGLSVMTNVSSSYDVFLTPNGLTMMAVELGVGGVLAFVLFSLTVTSLPHLLDKEVDFVTAMLLSLQVVRQNPVVMLVWAGLIAVVTLVAMVPMFLGLFVALPVLGHATWHLYRRALP
ncbi:DUF2189 domain-containing protein [Celeribacter halophilus]|jgi:uncharacterized membrane protein|uniref:DUF2189 domain-containing protein n=1 Tax=Celeribacter halophilus TaxID=576117 RepID=UPI001C083ECE|nr:DUF2189 domain-containing protein [Celeribacter halophilus]MBU2888533.1 DUF2189 domain-containing protein [Celeribacter halophilus]MDO6509113.1 DUF2189 domain-containing protein [Celeribacter halophilus]